MIRDRDRIYGAVVTRRLRAMGIRDKPIAPASPWQNGFAERIKPSLKNTELAKCRQDKQCGVVKSWVTSSALRVNIQMMKISQILMIIDHEV